MADYAMVIDYKYCTGCHSCEISCRKEKGLPLEEWGIKLSEQGPAKIQGKWMWNYVPVPSDACDMCIKRIGEDKKPICELHCLAQCLEILPMEEAARSVAEKGTGVALFVPGDQGF